MPLKTTLPVILHKTAQRKPFEDQEIIIELDKPELFKYAIFQRDVPVHIKESDFDYLQSKVPALDELNSDYISLTEDRVINLGTGDRTLKEISELCGVAIGLKYATLLLDLELNKFKKIGVASKGKYLDYQAVKDGKSYELEAKGTIQENYNNKINDIILKKKGESEAYLRFGTIALLQGQKYSRSSSCVIVDDPPRERELVDADYFRNQLDYYAVFLSFILDSKYFNYYVEALRNRIARNTIDKQKFYGIYEFNDQRFFGECFDYRLISENVHSIGSEELSVAAAFDRLTRRIGKTKIFIGLDERVIQYINNNDRKALETFVSQRISAESTDNYRFLDTDGILVIKSQNGFDEKLEKMFSEKDVMDRLNLHLNHFRGIAHNCGQPCTSPGLEGQACKIRTFREACHWHR